MDSNQAEELSRAADRITDAVRELSSSLDRFTEYQRRHGRVEDARVWWGDGEQRRPGELVLGFLGAGGLSEEEAVGLVVRETYERYDAPGIVRRTFPEGADPTPEQVRAWREARRKAERAADPEPR